MKRISPIRLRASDPATLSELKQNLQDTQEELTLAYSAFDYASDPDLTDYCIFTIHALQSRMNYLVKQIKEQESFAAAAGGRRARWIQQ